MGSLIRLAGSGAEPQNRSQRDQSNSGLVRRHVHIHREVAQNLSRRIQRNNRTDRRKPGNPHLGRIPGHDPLPGPNLLALDDVKLEPLPLALHRVDPEMHEHRGPSPVATTNACGRNVTTSPSTGETTSAFTRAGSTATPGPTIAERSRIGNS